MDAQERMVAENKEEQRSIWYQAIEEGERRANVVLGPLLEDHLVTTLRSYVLDRNLCRVVARDFLSHFLYTNSETLISVAGRCLIITGFFPDISRRRNVREGYFIETGVGAYNAHASYWSAHGNRNYAKCSRNAAERFLDLVKTLRGMRNSRVVAEEIEALSVPELHWH